MRRNISTEPATAISTNIAGAITATSPALMTNRIEQKQL